MLLSKIECKRSRERKGQYFKISDILVKVIICCYSTLDNGIL